MTNIFNKTWQKLEPIIWSLAIAWMQKIIENEEQEKRNYCKSVRDMTLEGLDTETQKIQKKLQKVKKELKKGENSSQSIISNQKELEKLKNKLRELEAQKLCL